MSEWAYRKCEECGNRVHINFVCNTKNCNGDPWGIRKEALEVIEKLEIQKTLLQRQINDIDRRIIGWKKKTEHRNPDKNE